MAVRDYRAREATAILRKLRISVQIVGDAAAIHVAVDAGCGMGVQHQPDRNVGPRLGRLIALGVLE
jgi:hypothetical protein